MNTTKHRVETLKRVTNVVVSLALGVLLAVLVMAYAVPEAGASTPGTPPSTLDECVHAYYSLDAETFTVRQELDDVRAALVVVEGDRDRLVDEVTRLDLKVQRQAATIARLRERIAR